MPSDAQALPCCGNWRRNWRRPSKPSKRLDKTKAEAVKAGATRRTKRSKMFSQRSETNRTMVGINGGKNDEFMQRIHAESVNMMVQIPGASRPNPQENLDASQTQKQNKCKRQRHFNSARIHGAHTEPKQETTRPGCRAKQARVFQNNSRTLTSPPACPPTQPLTPRK